MFYSVKKSECPIDFLWVTQGKIKSNFSREIIATRRVIHILPSQITIVMRFEIEEAATTGNIGADFQVPGEKKANKRLFKTEVTEIRSFAFVNCLQKVFWKPAWSNSGHVEVKGLV